MYPVVFKGWLRLRIALAVFLAGGIFFPLVYLLGIDSDWYGQALLVPMFVGVAYLFFVGEWERVLYKRRKDPETRPRIVRVGTIVFLAGLFVPLLSNFQLVEDPLEQISPINLFLSISGLMIATGAASITWGIYDNGMKLPAKVEKSASNAMRMMKEAGREIHDDPLWIALDPRIKSAATTYPAEGGSVILVHPKYVDTTWLGGLDNILVHEMSHIYGIATNKPWETSEIVKDLEAKYKTARNYPTKSYQLKTIVRAAIYLGEMLTDDLAFQVLEQSKLPWIEPTGESLQILVRSKVGWALRTKRKRWETAMLIARNSILLSEMDRFKIPDEGDKAKTANQKLLSALPEEASRAYDRFYQRSLELKESVTEEEFKALMENYLSAFVEFAEWKKGQDKVEILPGSRSQSSLRESRL